MKHFSTHNIVNTLVTVTKVVIPVITLFSQLVEANADKIVKEPKVVIMKFGATWCPPCRFMLPELEAFHKAHPEIELQEIDVDKNPKTSNAMNVTALPTIILLKDGKEIARHQGFMTKQELDKRD